MSPSLRDVVAQPMLNFAAKDQTAATRLRSDFLAALSDGCWHLGKSLQRALGTNERVLRQIASDSGGSVLSGAQGYRLTRFASTAEIDHAEARLRSQARKMLRRSIQIRKCRNAGGQAA